MFSFDRVFFNMLKMISFLSLSVFFAVGGTSYASLSDDEGSDQSFETHNSLPRPKRPLLRGDENNKNIGNKLIRIQGQTDVHHGSKKVLRTPTGAHSSRSRDNAFTPSTSQNMRKFGVSPRRLTYATEQALLTPTKRNADAPHVPAIRSQGVRERIASYEVIPFDLFMAATKDAIWTRSLIPAHLPISGKDAPLVDLHASVSHPEESFETLEETLARRVRQRALLARVRHERSLSIASQSQSEESSLALEERTVREFTDYLSLRRAQVDSLGRMRRAELEEVFTSVFQSTYMSFDHEGYTVWYNPALLNLDAEIEGETNLERLECGRCPIGSDGESMNLHHVTHYDAWTHNTTSYLVLLHHTTHLETFHGDLHFESSEYYLPRTPVDRNLFNSARPLILEALWKILPPQDIFQDIL
ncbi:MAG: hypothetical protein C0514_00945 [Candidatus Puniceispirillum sp.]|nr:hypothetical protein [Candidatus Puniceispirillum sp.]